MLHDENELEAERPQAFLNSSTFRKLQQGYQQDLAASAALTPVVEQPAFAVYQLPNASWARRVSGSDRSGRRKSIIKGGMVIKGDKLLPPSEELNDEGYIMPGLGDAGDRAFGTE